MGSVSFESLTHRASFFQGNGEIPHPNPQSSRRGDVIVFGCQSTPRSRSHAGTGIASNLSLGVASFTLQEAGNRLYRRSPAQSAFVRDASEWAVLELSNLGTILCARKNRWPIFDLNSVKTGETMQWLLAIERTPRWSIGIVVGQTAARRSCRFRVFVGSIIVCSLPPSCLSLARVVFLSFILL